MKNTYAFIACVIACSSSSLSAATYSCILEKENIVREKVTVSELDFTVIPESSAVTLRKFNAWNGLRTLQARFKDGKVSFEIPAGNEAGKSVVLSVTVGDQNSFATVHKVTRYEGLAYPQVDPIGSGKCSLVSK